ncbi:DUF1566 domain-containing protein [Nitrosomonas oligotropha]|uniref:Lcl domain-containing protein n=1 Tax=Nitrosomonas oligotropha TaxID=42354 RepID=UPI00136B1A75|nr:DUF1566 domain-containing protein [Nitrosomonas oligotropha]MXS82234.1 DUF1566 domain-containing protein [Nitrosomonas oligotropha]
MIKLLRILLCSSVFSVGLLANANATLVARPDGMVYDTDLNITWLSDANYAKTSGSAYGYGRDHRMDWNEAMAWAASLNVGGVSDWRLPTTDAFCVNYNCTTSELGHLFYKELGGKAGHFIFDSSDPDLALFKNIEPVPYWSSTEFASDPSRAWIFAFSDGSQGGLIKNTPGRCCDLSAWAVHDGDVGAGLVPEPEMYAMMSIGLLALFGFRRLRQQS